MESRLSNDGRADDRRLFWLAYGHERRQQTDSSDDCIGLFSDGDEIRVWLILNPDYLLNENTFDKAKQS